VVLRLGGVKRSRDSIQRIEAERGKDTTEGGCEGAKLIPPVRKRCILIAPEGYKDGLKPPGINNSGSYPKSLGGIWKRSKVKNSGDVLGRVQVRRAVEPPCTALEQSQWVTSNRRRSGSAILPGTALKIHSPRKNVENKLGDKDRRKNA